MFDLNINFQYVQEVCIMSNQQKYTPEVKAQKNRTPLSSKVNLTKKQLTQIGLDSLNAYVKTSPEEHLGKFLDL